MNVLIIVERWGEESGIGFLRPMKIAKYFLKRGDDVTVVCGERIKYFTKFGRDIENMRKQELYTELPALGYSGLFGLEDRKWNEWTQSRKASKVDFNTNKKDNDNNIKSKIKNSIIYAYNNIYRPFKEKNAASVAYRRIHKSINPPDLIFSSYEPVCVHYLAHKIKKFFPNAFWIADFRDPMPWAWDSKIVYFYKRRLQKKICNLANATTIVSDSWKEQYEKDGIRNVFAIYSGYDIDDCITAEYPMNDKFTICYTGSLYTDKYDISIFFEALHELIHKKKVDPDKVKIVYAGPHPLEFNHQVSLLSGVVEIVNKGMLCRDAAIQLQNSSDILLLAAVNEQGGAGHITGKITEYWLTRKPVVAIISGSYVDTDLKKVIEKTKSGIAYEKKRHNQDYQKLMKYMHHLYNEYIEFGKCSCNYDEEQMYRFDYKNIVRELCAIRDKLQVRV